MVLRGETAVGHGWEGVSPATYVRKEPTVAKERVNALGYWRTTA
ncbi:hypothetical protein ACFYPZ_29375 [Streptomyces sp. NPDC005506]